MLFAARFLQHRRDTDVVAIDDLGSLTLFVDPYQQGKSSNVKDRDQPSLYMQAEGSTRPRVMDGP